MEMILFPANQRGEGDEGWLKSRFSFSFAHYYNPNKMGFGSLRVLNDDIISAGYGFPMHPHANMEIITFVFKGELTHRDSEGNLGKISKDMVQFMSAGTGILHSEYNEGEEDIELFQIWLLPEKKNIEPRYGEMKLDREQSIGKFLKIIGPNCTLSLNQKAVFEIGEFNKDDKKINLEMSGEKVYLMLIEGSIKISDQKLSRRDGIGFEGANTLPIEILEDKTRLLLIRNL